MKIAATKGVGAMMVQTILEEVDFDLMTELLHIIMIGCNTHCIMNGSLARTFWLDHSRPAHPITSPVAARQAVGISHHKRYLRAAKMWKTSDAVVLVQRSVETTGNRLLLVEMLKRTRNMIATLSVGV